MPLFAQVLIVLIAVLHAYICWLEMFAWERRGKAIFPALQPDLFAKTKVMAANQGLYNAFLAAGLIWSLLIQDPDWARHVAWFFLGCVAIAGLYGGVSVSRKIIAVQTVPACLAFGATLL
ncbi:DUF1304 domain-containing protein [Albirhodobacter sp. R86504]|uniref:DUF1304 domain-containing protein n=1 Tax=Albirhodobacter sp. R86504 TaxID=3093848 RepID=UPI003673031D